MASQLSGVRPIALESRSAISGDRRQDPWRNDDPLRVVPGRILMIFFEKECKFPQLDPLHTNLTRRTVDPQVPG
jgi:hypothetical protein